MDTLKRVWAAEVNVGDILPFSTNGRTDGPGALKGVLQNSYTPEGTIVLSLIDMMDDSESTVALQPTDDVFTWRI